MRSLNTREKSFEKLLNLDELKEIKMKRLVMSVLLSLPTLAFAQQKPMTLKAVLLEQLRSTHNKAEWFVPANTAVAGLTPAR